MASYIWPTTLPQKVLTDFSEDGGVRVLRTAMDAGAPKTRYIGRRANAMTVAFIMSTEQVAILKTFAEDTIKGVSPFEFPHPRTGDVVDVRIVSSDDGKLFTDAYYTPGYWTISMTFEVMP